MKIVLKKPFRLTWLGKIIHWCSRTGTVLYHCEKIYDYLTKDVIEIHSYDTWDMDVTLAKIIHPMLIQLRQNKDIKHILNDDIPLDVAKFVKDDEKFYWVLDCIINAFGKIIEDHNYKYEADVRYGLKLFYLYYNDLWE